MLRISREQERNNMLIENEKADRYLYQKKTIEVSVLCAAFNHEKYIRKTLQGFVNQKTSFGFEIIINDDASTDGTKAIIEEFVQKYPSLFVPIFQNENQFSNHIKITKEILLPHAQGKYIAFCEGDDYWCDESKLQMQYDILESNPQCSICLHPVQCINEDGSLNEKVIPNKAQQRLLHNGEIDEELLSKMIWAQGKYPFQTSSYFFRKSITDKWILHQLKFGDHMNGDLVLLRLAIMNGSYYYIDKSMSCYRLFSNSSWTSKFGDKTLNQLVDHYLVNIKEEKLFDQETSFKFHKYIQFRVITSVLAWSNYKPEKAKKILKKNGIGLISIFCNLPLKYTFYYICLYTYPGIHTFCKQGLKKLLH